MTLITKIPGVVFTDTTLPILYKDKSINTNTLFAYDIDPSSYTKQVNPVNGDIWNDLTYGNVNASFTVATPNSIGFSNGFSFNPVASNNYLTLPSSGKATANQDGFLYILWIKPTGISAVAYSGIAGCAQSTNLSQWSIDNGAANSGIYRIVGPNSSASYNLTPSLNSVYQIAFALKFDSSTGFYRFNVYINGVLVQSTSTGLTTIPQPSGNTIVGAFPTGFTSGAQFTLYRVLGYSTTGFAITDITTQVAADYAANSSRFS